MLIGIEANNARARHVLKAGESLYCALSWDDDAPVPSTFVLRRKSVRPQFHDL